MNTATKIEMVRQKTEKLLLKARANYDLDFQVGTNEITFDLKGQTAGKAWHWQNPDYSPFGSALFERYKLRRTLIQFNVQAIEKDFDHVYNETIPHEIAHLVTWDERSRTGKQRASHGREWQLVCIDLGGTAKRCHSINLEKARKTRQWKYVLDSGKVHILKTTRHNRLQRGESGYSCAATGESIKKHHFVGEA